MKRVSRATPRTISTILVALVVATGVVGINHALAQGSTVQLVNPSGYSNPQVISNQTDVDNNYHLVAWVGNIQQNQLVEFEYQRTGERAQSIGFGTQNGSTFDLLWPVNVLDGNYTLRAILYQNSVEISRDEAAVIVNNSGEGQNTTTDAETVEITDPGIIISPTNASGTLGIFHNGTTSNFVMDVRFSTGTQFIQAFYTNSAPGTEPAWKSCGPPKNVRPQGSPPSTVNPATVKCTLQAGDTAESLRAVAAVANDSPQPLGFSSSFNDSGDAHPVTTYNQVPTSVTVQPANTSGTLGECTSTITARVRDQETQEIVGINVDVHASGPNDSLAFDTGRNNNPSSQTQGSDQNQPPNSSHGGFEPAEICPPASAAPTNGGTQGRHNRVGTNNWDVKHVESVPGTDEDGTFDFRLFNATLANGGGPGTTLITAWADTTEDDLLCANELRGTATVTWGSTSTVGAIENDPNCPTPPPPTRTLTVTKSGAGTGTVTSSPAGINCGNDCSETYSDGTVVTLTANPNTPSTFTGWTGCDSTSGPSGTQCTVTMAASRTVNASFASGNERVLTVTKSGTGAGTVTSSPAGINCGNDCSEAYANGTFVTLTANPNTPSTFTGWTGCDSTSGVQCTVTMTTSRTVNASFASGDQRTLSVTKSGSGTGTVTSSPSGINCGNDCTEGYSNGTSVTLSATPTTGSTFAGFTGCDSTAGNECVVNMNANRTVNAVFNSTSTSTATQTQPGSFTRSLILETSHRRRSFGGGFNLEARLSPQTVGTPASCLQGVAVSLQRTVVGDTGSTVVGSQTTDSQGIARFNLTADRSANYVASVAQAGVCSAATSNSESVLVRKRVRFSVSRQRVRAGSVVRLVATVTPCDGHEGDNITLFKIVGGDRLQIGSKASNFNCAATFRKAVRRDSVFQARSPKQDSDHLRGTSPRRGVDVI